jgi:hypothetical protein
VGTLNKPSVKERYSAAATGTNKHITGNVTLGGVVYSPAMLAAVFLAANTAIDTADAAHKQWLTDVAAMDAAKAKANAVLKLLRSYVVSQYGTDNKSVLGDFGMNAPKTKSTKSSATKAAAAQKAKATRTVRHTMGKKQRKTVKGTVEVPVTAAGATAPATPATTSATGGTAAPNGASVAPAGAASSPAKPTG